MAPPIDPERLLAQTTWVRRLAGSLARDAAEADDLAQDTLEIALRRPPADLGHDHTLRAWLAKVARNLAFSRAHAERRRAKREQAGARAEHTDSEERLLELEELRSKLVRHVLELAELPREIVVLHFFEELTPVEIAKRLGMPVSTVRNHIRRALAELRAELERENGSDWRSLCLFVAPAARTHTLAGAGTGSLAFLAANWILLGALALIGGLAWFAWPASPLEPLAVSAATELGAPPALDRDRGHPELADESGSARTAAPAAATTALPPKEALPATIRVRGTVNDEHGRPVARARLQWFDELALQHNADVAAGEYLLEGAHAGRWIVATGGSGSRGLQFEVLIAPTPAEQRRDFTVPASIFLPIRLTERSGKPLLRVENPDPRLSGDGLEVFATREVLPASLPELTRQQQGFTGCARFWNRMALPRKQAPLPAGYLGLLELMDDPPLHVALVQGTRVIARQELASLPEELSFAIAEQDIRATDARVRLRVLRPDGKTPLTDGQVILGCDSPRALVVGPDGRAELVDAPPGPCLVGVTARGCNKLQFEFELEPASERDLGDLVLLPYQRLRVRFVLPHDPDAIVRFVLQREFPADPLRTMGCFENAFESRTRTEGIADIAWPGPGRYLLRVLGVGEESKVGETVVPNAPRLGTAPLHVEFGGAPPSELVVRLEPTVDLALHPPRGATGWTHWLVAAHDGSPCQSISLWRQKPQRLELVPGEYTVARIDEAAGTIGAPRAFKLGSEPLALELGP